MLAKLQRPEELWESYHTYLTVSNVRTFFNKKVGFVLELFLHTYTLQYYQTYSYMDHFKTRKKLMSNLKDLTNLTKS